MTLGATERYLNQNGSEFAGALCYVFPAFSISVARPDQHELHARVRMTWLALLPILAVLASAAYHAPYDALRIAVRNTTRGDGERSDARTRREHRHGRRLAWRALGLPLLILVCATVGMQLFHHFGMPDSTLAELFGDQHPEVSLHAPDLEAWSEAIERSGEYEAYEAWRQRQGYSPLVRKTLVQRLTTHWPLHVIFLLLSSAFGIWYAVRVIPHAAEAYRKAALERNLQYVRRDVDTV